LPLTAELPSHKWPVRVEWTGVFLVAKNMRELEIDPFSQISKKRKTVPKWGIGVWELSTRWVPAYEDDSFPFEMGRLFGLFSGVYLLLYNFSEGMLHVEILHHLGCIVHPLNNEINYQPVNDGVISPKDVVFTPKPCWGNKTSSPTDDPKNPQTSSCPSVGGSRANLGTKFGKLLLCVGLNALGWCLRCCLWQWVLLSLLLHFTQFVFTWGHGPVGSKNTK